MKKMLIIFTIAAVAVSCKSKTAESLDTQKEMVVTYPAYNNTYATDQGNMGSAASVAYKIPKSTPVAASTSSNNVSTNTSNNTSTTTTTTTTKKKGWSNAAKGTVIGAGTGAIVGAVVSKKKGVGAVVGGLLGAGAGYAIGNEKDKKKKN